MADEDGNENVLSDEKHKTQKRDLSVVLQTMDKLTVLQPNVRIKNASTLIRHLKSKKNTEEREIDDRYVLGRLVRGCGATKESSRIGFYTTLCVYLQSMETNRVGELLALAAKELHAASKSEEGDVYTGHILLAGAIIRSGQIYGCAKALKTKVMDLLRNAGKRKSYLQMPANTFLAEFIDNISHDEFEELLLERLISELNKPIQGYTLDDVFVLLKICSKIGKKRRANLANVPIDLRDTEQVVEILMRNAAHRFGSQHPVHAAFLRQVVATGEEENYFSAVNANLMHKQPGIQIARYHLAVNMYVEYVKNDELKEHALGEIFSERFVKLTLEQLQKQNKRSSDLVNDVCSLLDAIVACNTTINDKVKLIIIERCTANFDRVTRNKFIARLIQTLKAEGVHALADIYHQWMAPRELAKLLNHVAIRTDIEWRANQLERLMRYALVDSEHSGACKPAFFSALHLKCTTLAHLRNILSQLVKAIDGCFEAGKLNIDIDGPLWRKTLSYITKSQRNEFFHALFMQMALIMLTDARLANNTLNELFACYDRQMIVSNDNEDDIAWVEVIIDLFLNLLSHNSQLLRNLVTAVFAYICPKLTKAAVSQMVSVLDCTNNDVLSDDEDVDDEEMESTTDDDDNEDEKEFDVDDDDGDDDDEEEETTNDKLRQAMRLALGNVSDENDIDIDEMSDSQGERLNYALGAAFTTYKPQINKSNKQKQSVEAETLTHFRVRVVDLLEIYLDSEAPTLGLCVDIVLPLLRALEFTVRDPHQRPLQSRLAHCLRKLTSRRNFNQRTDEDEDVGEETLCALLMNLLKKGTKSTLVLQEMSDYICDCALFTIRLMHTLHVDSVVILKILYEAIDIFFKRRDASATTYTLIKQLFGNLAWDGNVQVARRLIGYAFDDSVRPFRHNQALELLRAFYQNTRLLTILDADALATLAEDVHIEAMKLLNKGDVSAIKEKFVAGLFALLNAIVQRNALSKASRLTLGERVRTYRSNHILGKETLAAFCTLCSTLNVSPTVEMSATAVPLSSNVAPVQEATVKRKRSSSQINAKKLRKEAQHRRLTALSDGLSTQ